MVDMKIIICGSIIKNERKYIKNKISQHTNRRSLLVNKYTKEIVYFIMLLSDLLKYSKYKNLCESFTQDSLFRKYTKWYKDKELYLKYKLPTYNYRYSSNGDLIQLYSNSFSKYDKNVKDYDSKEVFEETSYGSEKTRKRMLGQIGRAHV